MAMVINLEFHKNEQDFALVYPFKKVGDKFNLQESFYHMCKTLLQI